MNNKSIISNIIGWIFGLILFVLGVMNLILVHPVPGIAYLLFSLSFFPSAHAYFRNLLGFSIPFAVKIILFLVIIWFTLGISDLAEMYGL